MNRTEQAIAALIHRHQLGTDTAHQTQPPAWIERAAGELYTAFWWAYATAAPRSLDEAKEALHNMIERQGQAS